MLVLPVSSRFDSKMGPISAKYLQPMAITGFFLSLKNDMPIEGKHFFSIIANKLDHHCNSFRWLRDSLFAKYICRGGKICFLCN